MKSRFSTVDILAMVSELRESVVGMRVTQVYDVDNKTYLFKLNRQEEKSVLLIESGVRFHKTDYAWPKSQQPSGFSMKLRKHLKNKRIESIAQVGVDRIIDIQFGINEAAYHVILELYDKGNIVLTDHEYLILNILRPRTVGTDDDVKFIVREKYPVGSALQDKPMLKEEELQEILQSAKSGDNIKKVLNPKVLYGPAVLDHVLCGQGLSAGSKIGKDIDVSRDMSRILTCLQEAEEVMNAAKDRPCRGYITQKVEKRVQPAEDGSTEIVTYNEFHPFLYRQHESGSFVELPSFSAAVDQFFSSVEMQKISLRAHNQEKEALKKLENIRIDHEKRISALEHVQMEDIKKAELIETNLELVDRALLVLRSALANQIEWNEISVLIKEAQEQGDPVALAIKELKLDVNHFTMYLQDPYETSAGNGMLVSIDLDLSAYSNARKYYDQKKHAAKKQQKTIESSTKAYKSAEKKTKETLKQVALTTNIAKARKAFWFEKFYWFISSEDYLVIGGRDAQQNEMIVKRYMKPGDVYVHADLHGASSIIIKNPGGNPVPPKTLNEAGTMAICYSAAWDAKVVTSAWWVYHHQVSKTAPTGQFLTPGAFMIRGKKNYLPPSYLIMGFGFMYKLDEDSIERHRGERQARTSSEDFTLQEDGTDNTADDTEIAVSEQSSSEDEGVAADGDPETGGAKFPDTVVKLPHEISTVQEAEKDEVEVGEVVYSQPSRSAQVKQKPKAEPKPDVPAEPASESNKPSGVPNRRTKGKLKKIREKYKDQDEEERQLRMEILKSAGAPKEPKRKGKKAKKLAMAAKSAAVSQAKATAGLQTKSDANPQPQQTARLPEATSELKGTELKVVDPDAAKDDDDDVEEEVNAGDEDKRLLASLTGCPVPEDGLIFAVPVAAPYIAMQNYKHKVKVTPGTGRRGKAAKTALNVFMLDKATTPRERDLVRAVKDLDISRNLPGKVKLSAPNFQKRK
uniref:Putative rna-binding protein n=1 Tax=Ornithodoros turicata TaxID=34597 RepID=A0A2R5LNK1_9ACAR